MPIAFGLVSATEIHAQKSQVQANDATIPKFEYEVASFKPNKSDNGSVRNNATPGGITGSNVTLLSLVLRAYGVRDFQVSGAPEWLSSERYDFAARMESSVSDAFQKLSPADRNLARQHMLQAVLADRIKLTIHHETKELPIYSLAIAKNGAKVKEAKPGDTYPNGFKGRDGGIGTGFIGEDRGGLHKMTAQAVSIANLIATLAGPVDCTIVNKTGLTGRYDFTLEWATVSLTVSDNEESATAPMVNSSGLSIFAALQQQLGLKLVSGKGPVEVIVIDHVERPSPN